MSQSDPHYWSPGEPVLYREVLQGRVWTARPVTVIADTPAQTVLYLAHGTRWQRFWPVAGDAPALMCKSGRAPWELKEFELEFGDSILLWYPGDAHVTHLMWDLAGAFIGWYVNLQEPLRRTRLGFDTLDQELDLVVQPNGDWRWKDTEHLAQAEALGVFTAAQCAAVRAEGERVVRRIEARAAPFDGAWLDWRAPAEWPVAVLPEGWKLL